MDRHTDQAGRVFAIEMPANCTDTSLGHIIGPPVFEAGVLKLDVDAILIRLHNELLVRGIITLRDAAKPGAPRAITDAIRAATSPIISVSDVIAAYREEET
jgi:hypothetical protein